MNNFRKNRQIYLLLVCMAGALLLISCECVISREVGKTLDENGFTHNLTKYRQQLHPAETQYDREGVCISKGTIEIDSKEYLRYDAPDFADWNKDSLGIVYLLPKQGRDVLVQETSLPIPEKSDIPVGFFFYFMQIEDISDQRRDQQIVNGHHPLVRRMERFVKGLKERYPADFPPQAESILCVGVSSTGYALVTLLKKDSEWVEETGLYLVKRPSVPLHEKLSWRDTWYGISSAGYLVTVPIDTAYSVTLYLCMLPLYCMYAAIG